MLLVSASGSLLVRKRTILCCSSGEALGTMAPYIKRKGSVDIGVASGMAGRALALPIMPPQRDIAARATLELFAEYSLAHVICVCAQPIIYSLLRPW